MNRFPFARLLPAVAFLAAAVALPVHAAPPVRPQPIDDATLAGVTGRYYGASMLVGLRVDIVSTLQTPSGSASATGSLTVQRNGNGNGFDVQVDTHAHAHGQAGGNAAASGASARGGETVQIDGIAQVTQIAGDRNRMGNLTSISFAPSVTPLGSPNGTMDSHAQDGTVSARVTFAGGGAELAITAPGALLAQRFDPGIAGGSARIAQLGQIAANDVTGSNQLHLQLATQAMSAQLLRQLGVQQALSGMLQLGR